MHSDITLYKQIHPCHCQCLANIGFKSLINLRFDDECQNQPSAADLGVSAKQAGLQYHHLPIDGANIHLDSVKAFADIVHDLPKPIMVFCSTGGRAKRLYQCAVVSGLL